MTDFWHQAFARFETPEREKDNPASDDKGEIEREKEPRGRSGTSERERESQGAIKIADIGEEAFGSGPARVGGILYVVTLSVSDGSHTISIPASMGVLGG